MGEDESGTFVWINPDILYEPRVRALDTHAYTDDPGADVRLMSAETTRRELREKYPEDFDDM